MSTYGSGGPPGEVRVEVRRGDTVESLHRVHVAVCDADGTLQASAGDARFRTFARSSIKAIQALPLVEAGGVEAFGLTDAELALCCASHGGEPYHVDAARSILRKIGETEDALACGAHSPLHPASAAALRELGQEPGRIHNNCSGKHAGMLALAVLRGWKADGYHEPDHPVQQCMAAEVVRWTGIARDAIETAVDGCGVVTFALPLSALAAAFARFGHAAHAGEAGPARLVAAMRSHPEYVAGTDRLCTGLMRVTEGRVVAKVGAEGVYVAGVPADGLGVALKVEDGAKRAVEPALLAVLRELAWLTSAEHTALERYAEPAITNTRGEPVGRIRVVPRLETYRG